MKPGKSYPLKHRDDYDWWENGRYNPWDTDESIWRNTNMIWIVGFAPMVIGLLVMLILAAVGR